MVAQRSTWLERLVDERVVMAVIVFNLLVLFVRAFQGSVAFEAFLFQLDYACLVYFFIEMAVKIRLAGWRGFWARAINRFDFLLVVASTPTLISPFTPVEELSVVLVFRAARVLRLLRLLRFIPHAEMMWAGVMRALRASVGFMVALVAYNLLLGIIGAHIFGEVAPEHFGDPLRGMYTMFKVFTVEGWYEVPDAIAASVPHLGTLARGFFVFSVLTGGILGFSIANAVFVDEMVMDNNNALEANVARLSVELERVRCENAALVSALDAKLDRLLGEDAGGSDGR